MPLRLSFITPTAYINSLGKEGDFTMALAHLLEIKVTTEYEKAIKEAGLPIILDNGCFEKGYPDGIDALINKAQKINAAGVFMPDWLYDNERTNAAIDNFIYVRDKMWPNFKPWLGAIIQADSLSQYLKDYKEYNNNPDISVIGLSYLAIAKCLEKEKSIRDKGITNLRKAMMTKMFAEEMPKKPLHLLGIGESYEDVLMASQLNAVNIYNDSSICFQAGLLGNSFTSLALKEGKPKNKVDFEMINIGAGKEALIRNNIKFIKNTLCLK